MHGALQAADRSFLVIMMANRDFAPFIQNWLCNTAHMDGVHQRTLLLFTDDGYTALGGAGFRVATVGNVGANLTLGPGHDIKYGTVGYWRLVQRRVQVVASLVRAGIPFLLCEPDALWVRNPLTDPVLHSTAEMVYYRDNGEIPGFGFLRLWPTAMVRSLFSAVEAEFGRQMPGPTTEASASIDITSEQNFLHRLLEGQGGRDRALALSNTKYVSGKWYSQGVDGRRSRGASKSDGTPYVINQNWIVGNSAKISRAKQWGHWFLQNEEAGTCHNASLLHDQMAAMLATMSSLKCGNCPEPPGLAAAVAWSILLSIAACIVLPRLPIGLPGCSGVVSETSVYCKAAICLVTFVLALGINGVLDAELGDMHGNASRRRQHGISVYLSGNDDTGQSRGLHWTLSLVALTLVGWRLGVPIAASRGVSKRQEAWRGLWPSRWRILGRRQRTCLVLVIAALVVAASILDAETGDMHSDERRRSPLGLTLYVTIPDLLFRQEVIHYGLCLCVVCIFACANRRGRRVLSSAFG